MIWMRRGDCPAVFSLEILRRTLCTGEESAPRKTGRGTQQLFKQTDTAFCSTTPPRRKMAFSSRHHKVSHGEDLRTRTPQGDGNQFTYCTLRIGRLLFKNQNPARGRKRLQRRLVPLLLRHLRTRTPQGDGAYLQPPLPERGRWHTQCAGGGAMDASRKPS